MKAYLALAIRVYRDEHGRRTIKTKIGNQEDRFAVGIITYSIGNNKTTVWHLSIPSQLLTLARSDWKAPSIKAD